MLRLPAQEAGAGNAESTKAIFRPRKPSGWKPPNRPWIRALPVDRQLALSTISWWKLLSKVSEQGRTLILLKEVEGYSVEELAARTGLNENTIKVKLFRTRQKLLRAAHRLGRIQAVGKTNSGQEA